MFTVQSENSDKKWLKNAFGDVIDKNNIDSYIPQLSVNRADEIIKEINDVNTANGSWNEYYKTLKSGEDYVVDLIKNTGDLSRLTGDDLVAANQNARNAAIAHNNALKQQTLSAKAANVAMKALSVAGNMLAMWAISELVTGLHKLSQVSDEVAEKAQEMGQSFGDTKSSIDDYKSQISDLYETINDSGSSVEEVTEARKQLLTVQDKMITKFGNEAETVRFVTDAIYGQVDALGKLTEKQWQQTKNDFNESGFWNDIANHNDGYNNNIDRMVDEYGNHSVELNLSTAFDIKDRSKLDKFKKILEDDLGVSIFNFTGDEDSPYAKIEGDAEEVYNILLEIQSLNKEFRFNDSFNKQLTKATNNTNDLVNKYSELYNQYILYEKVLNNSTSTEYFNKLQDAYQEYQDIFSSGENTDDAVAKLQGILNEATLNIDDENIIKFFEGMYPELESVFANWEFKINILPGIDVREWEGLSKGDLLTAFTQRGIQKGELALDNLIREAIESDLISDDSVQSVEYLLDLLVEWGKIQADINDTTADYKPPSPATITDSVKQIAAEVEPQFAKLGELYESIWYTDNGFDANAIDNKMLEELRDSFLELEEGLGISFDASAIENFNKVLADGVATEEEAQNAFDDLATAWFYSSNTLENLNDSTAAAIVQQLEQLGVTNAQEVIDSHLEKQKLDLALAEEYLTKTGKDLENATSEEIQSFIWSGQAADATADHYINLAIKKQVAENPLDSTADVAALENICTSLGVTGELYEKVSQLKMAFKAIDIGATDKDYWAMVSGLQAEIQDILNGQNQVKVDLSTKWPDTSSDSDSSSAGKDAGDAYVEAFEKELEALDGIYDRGEIDTKTYLDRLKALYEKYFKDRKEYAEEYAKYERQWQEKSLELMESAANGIIKLYERRKDAIEDAKDAAIDALEEQKEAEVEALEAQKEALEAQQEAIEKQQDAIDKQISIKEKEIDAIQEANDERQREIDLQKAQYELNRLMNQRTNLVYTSEQGFVYRPDESAIRDQKQEVDDAETEIRIAQYEKEIAYLEERKEQLEDQKDVLAEQADLIDKQIDAVNEHYDKLIESTEKMYDQMISSIEDQMSKWQELLAFKEIAEAHSAISQVFGDLGYTVEDVMNGSGQAFEDFKAKYISLLSDMNSNVSFQEGLAYAVGDASDKLGVLDEAIGKTSETLGILADSVPDLSPISGEFEEISTTSEGAATGVGEVADAVSAIAENTSGLDSLNNLPDSETVKGLATEFGTLATNLEAISKALGLSEEGAIGSLVSQLQTITSMEIATEGGLVEYFNNLADAIDKATMALTGQSSGGTGEKGNGKTLGSQAGEAGSSEGGANTFADAIDEATSNGKAKIEEIAHAFHEEGNPASVSGAIGEVITKLGNPDAEEEGTFTTALQKHLEFATNPDMGIPYETSLFTELKNVIVTAQEALEKIQKALEEMDGKTFSAEFNLTGNASSVGFLGVGGSMGSKYTLEAYDSGRKTGKEEDAVVGEFNPEAVIRDNGTIELFDKPTVTHLNKNDVVLNPSETKDMVENAEPAWRTNAYDDGRYGKYSFLSHAIYDPEKFQNFLSLQEQGINPLLSDIAFHVEAIDNKFQDAQNLINNVSNINRNQNITIEMHNTINCPNVTNDSGVEYLKREFKEMKLLAMQKVYER